MAHSSILWQLVSALVVLLGVVSGYIRSRTVAKANHVETAQKIDAVQETVNGVNLELRNRVEQLTTAMHAAGVPVPDAPASDGA